MKILQQPAADTTRGTVIFDSASPPRQEDTSRAHKTYVGNGGDASRSSSSSSSLQEEDITRRRILQMSQRAHHPDHATLLDRQSHHSIVLSSFSHSMPYYVRVLLRSTFWRILRWREAHSEAPRMGGPRIQMPSLLPILWWVRMTDNFFSCILFHPSRPSRHARRILFRLRSSTVPTLRLL